MQHISAQVETTDAIPEMWPLLQRHWDEIALDKDDVPLDPDWDLYRTLESMGQLLIVTLRAQGVMVGYAVMFIRTEAHYRSTLCGRMDVFWIDPAYRGRMGGVRLFRAVEKELARRGVRRVFMGSKLHKDSSRLFVALGYRPIEMWFSKIIARGE